jgi:hypothetical protein
MPSKSKAQQRYFGVQLARKRAGKATSVDMTEAQLKEFAQTPLGKLPNKVKKKKT